MKKVLISQKIREYRRTHHLTQEESGKLLGVSAQAVSKWERVECYPDISFLPEIAAVLQCDMSELFEM